MSEIEDFTVDEDCWRDIEEKEELFFTQLECNVQTQGNKRPRSLSPFNDDFIAENGLSKKFCSATKGKENNIKTESVNKNLLLNILESNSRIISPQISLSKPSSSNQPLLSSRKNLLLDVITNNFPHTSEEKAPLKNQRPLKPLSEGGCNSNNKRTRVSKSTYSEAKEHDRSNYGSPRTPISRISISKSPKLPKSVVRKFPGPAGLFSDNLKDADTVDAQVLEVIDNYNENENSIHNDSSMHLCSQNTEKLFSNGAWQFMLNDLPTDFLRGYNISSVKRMTDTCKISLLAAVIQRVDLRAEHPRVILKDISDSIEALMHKDIFMTYESILKIGAVVLLRDVGLVNFHPNQKSSTTALVMITPASILGIYGDTCRLITTPALKEILEDNSDYERSRNCIKLRPQIQLVESDLNESDPTKLSITSESQVHQQECLETERDKKKNDLLIDDCSMNAFNSFNDDDADVEAALTLSRKDESTSKNISPKDDQADSSGNMSAGFADHLFNDDDDDDLDEADAIISQIDVDAFEHHSGI